MLFWWRHSPSLFCHVGRKLEQNLRVPLNIPNVHTTSTSSLGSLLYLQRTLQSSSTSVQRPIYQYLQQLEISSSSRLLVESSSDVKPVASPLMPVLGPSSGKAENQAAFVKPSKVQAVLKGIQQMEEEFGLLRCAFRETGPNVHSVLVGNEGAKLNALHYIGEVKKPHSSCSNLIMDHNNQNSLLAAKGIRLNRSGLPLFNGHHSVMPGGNTRICHGGIAFFHNSRHSILPADNVRQYHSGGPCNMKEKRNIRDHKRRLLAAKHELRRKLYKAFCTDTNLPNDVRYKLRYKLSKLPRNSSFARVRNRCIYTGRPRAVYEDFRISRIMLRQLASQGLLNGIRKSSW